MSAGRVSEFSINSHTIRGVIQQAISDENSDTIYIQAGEGEFVADEAKHLEQQHGLFILRAAPGTLIKHGLTVISARKKGLLVWCRRLGHIHYSHVSIEMGKPIVWRVQ